METVINLVVSEVMGEPVTCSLTPECLHPTVGEPVFDEVAACGLSSAEVRARWPRLHCPDCNTTMYASAHHYHAGDW